MSLATKIAAGLCICPVVAAPPVMMHKPTRDKIARAAGYVPKAQKPVSAPIAVSPQVECVEPTPSAPMVAMNELARPGQLPSSQLPLTLPDRRIFSPLSPPGGGTDGGVPLVPPIEGGVIPGIPEPATWTVMVVGFGMVGAAIRRTNRDTAPKGKPSDA